MARINIVNGVNVTALMETIEAAKETPLVAEFEFRADNRWFSGGYNRTTIKDFTGGQKGYAHARTFELDADEPPVLLGEDKAPNPVEYLLTALASCVTTTIVYHAAAKGIRLNRITSHLEGDLDLRGVLGFDGIQAGFKEIRMRFAIDADISDEEKEELIDMGRKYSPVFNTIFNATPIAMEIDRRAREAVAA